MVTDPDPQATSSPLPIPVHAPSRSPTTASTSTSQDWNIPTLRIDLQDIEDPGTQLFLASCNLSCMLREAVVGVLKRLYSSPSEQPSKVKQISLIIRDCRDGGVAYTTGTPTKREIHFNTPYIANLKKRLSSPAEVTNEILGVVRHEMVHVWQYDGRGSAPGGLIEGVADWVRMFGFAAPHWERGGERWDDGFEITAYFLSWIEEEKCGGLRPVRRINGWLKKRRYSKRLWQECCGEGVKVLWKRYCEVYGIGNPHDGDGDGDSDGDGDGDDGDGESEGEDSDDEDSDGGSDGTDEDIVVVPVPVPSHHHHHHLTPSTHPPPTAPSITGATCGDTITRPPSSASSRSAISWPQSSTSPIAKIMRSRLAALTFDGTSDAKRFIREFEQLLERVQPNASEADKRLLFVTALRRKGVQSWYEEFDLDDNLPYDKLKKSLCETWKGREDSERSRKILDRDARVG